MINLEAAINNFATRLDDRRDVLVSAIQCFKATDNVSVFIINKHSIYNIL